MNKIYILGETHGIKENIDVIKYLIKELNINHILFEVPTDLNTGDQLDQERLLAYAQSNPDGRICAEHTEFIKTLPDIHISSQGFDISDTDESKDRDENMKNNVIQMTQILEGNILIVCGNLHAQRTAFTHEGVTHQYLGYLLNKENIPFTNIKVTYGSGTFHNFEIQKLDENKLDVPSMTLLDSTDGDFNMFIYIPTAHHATTLAKGK